MHNLLEPANLEIWYCDPQGIRLELLDYISEYEYQMIQNGISPFMLRLPAQFDRNLIMLDAIIEIWRGHGPQQSRFDYLGFLRKWRFIDDGGVNYTELYGLSANDILRRRHVKDYAGSSQADKSVEADDFIKAVANEQMGLMASVDRGLSNVGGGFSIQASQALAEIISKGFAYKNVYTVCCELAGASEKSGTPLYFDIVPIFNSDFNGMIALELRTYVNQRGNDRGVTSNNPVYVGSKWGNMKYPIIDYDYMDEVNWVYVAGQGEGADRDVVSVSDDGLVDASIWNRREGVMEATGVDKGDTVRLTSEGYTALAEGAPIERFEGDVVETPDFRFGREWWYGDRVVAVFGSTQQDAIIDRVRVAGNKNGEAISSKLELTNSLSSGGGGVA